MPKLYELICDILDNYHVPYARQHGFIPHMTLAYIPKNADIPVDTIEPIEINFSEIYYVDGNVWYPVDLVGYDNKSVNKQAPLVSVPALREMQNWQDLAFRKHKKGLPLSFEWEARDIPADIADGIRARLAEATDEAGIKAAFDITAAEPEQVPNDEIKSLADALNNMAAALQNQQGEIDNGTQ